MESPLENTSVSHSIEVVDIPFLGQVLSRESTLSSTEPSELDLEEDLFLGEDARITQVRYLRNSFRDMVTDRVHSVSPETVKLIPITLNGIIQLCQEDKKRKSRLQNRIRELKTSVAEIRTENKGWIRRINFLKVDSTSVKETIRQLRTEQDQFQHNIAQLRDEKAQLCGKNNDLRCRIVELQQTIECLQRKKDAQGSESVLASVEGGGLSEPIPRRKRHREE